MATMMTPNFALGITIFFALFTFLFFFKISRTEKTLSIELRNDPSYVVLFAIFWGVWIERIS